MKKAHLIPRCREGVYVELLVEAEVGEDECGKLIYWLYGCRQAGQAWEDHYSKVLMRVGFRRSFASPVAFYHQEPDIVGVVHGDDFVFTGVDAELDFVLETLQECYELKNRGRLGRGPNDRRETSWVAPWPCMIGGIEWRADARHRTMILEYFGMGGGTRSLVRNGYKDDTPTG